jgi:hypothetical protein
MMLLVMITIMIKPLSRGHGALAEAWRAQQRRHKTSGDPRFEHGKMI